MPASLFNKAANLRPATLLKKRMQQMVLSCTFCETFKQNTSGRLLLSISLFGLIYGWGIHSLFTHKTSQEARYPISQKF